MSNQLNLCALLPMKGHSERVPNKNLKTFASKPLYHAITNELLKSKYITEIFINTDSKLIESDVRVNFPLVKIIERPIDLVGDFVPMNEIIAYDLSKIECDLFIQTHSTNPLLLAKTIDSAIDIFLKNRDKYDSLFSVTRLQTRLYWETGEAINHKPTELIRTQDLPAVLEENSCIYIFSRESFINSGKKRIGKNPCLFVIEKIEAMDIDEPQEFIIAEQMYRLLRNNN